jgi:hypothetical protein
MNCNLIRYTLFTVLAALLFLTGCGGKGTVTGTVRHRAKPVVWGTVSMIASDDMQYTGPIELDGTYKVENVPNGAVKILVSSPDPLGARDNQPNPTALGDFAAPPSTPDGPPRPAPGAWFPIPLEYSDLEKTSLKGTVRYDTTIDLNLP